MAQVFAFHFEDSHKAESFEVACINLGMETTRTTRYPYGDEKDDVVNVYVAADKYLLLHSMAKLIEDKE